ncbi:hypothetical protein K456DRAFT_1755461 [Colletotrichum gloeosporioides 23]|nr:hypothetical protein K456DRAFT_1755461 [Colletotrichum gloeosporioides 23]
MPTPPTTFHLFPNFTAKLRDHIWELTIEHRIVELQTSHEARVHLTKYADDEYRYGRTLSGIITKAWDGFHPLPEGDPEQERYVWFNFDSDMLSIGDTDLHEFLAVAHNLDDGYFSRAESVLIGRRLRNVVEVHLICSRGIRLGYVMTEDTYFPCGPNKVYFIHPEAIECMVINSVDLDAV